MGFDLGGLGKLLDPGAMAHQLVDSFLPKDMQWVGGLVGAAVDYECGNIPGAISQGVSALSDLKDVPQSSARASGSSAPNAALTAGTNQNQTWNYEPSPPPSRTTTVTTTTTTTSSSTSTPSVPATRATFAPFRAAVDQLRKNAPQSTTTSKITTTTTSTSAPSTKAPSTEGFFSGSLHAVADQLQKSASRPTTTSTTTTTITTTSSNAPGVTSSSAQASVKPNAAPTQAAPSGAAPTATASASSPASATDSTSSNGISDAVKKLLAMSNDDLQRAIASGNIPKDLSNGDMLALQTRMNQISQMNQMMTQMISAMHDMQMAVARNIHA